MPSKLTKTPHSGTDKPTTCPTCGAEVRVGGRTTKYYVPKRTVETWAVFVNGRIDVNRIYDTHIYAEMDMPSDTFEYKYTVRRVEISWSEE